MERLHLLIVVVALALVVYKNICGETLQGATLLATLVSAPYAVRLYVWVKERKERQG